MRFTVRFYSEKTRKTERHIVDKPTLEKALKTAMALTDGKQPRDIVIIQEDE